MEVNKYLINWAKSLGRRIKKQHKLRSIPIKIIGCDIVPSLQRCIYTIKPTKKTKIKSILLQAEDIQSTLELPLFYAYKDGITIRIAVSEHEIVENSLLKILRSPLFTKCDMELPLAIGYDLMGNMHITDLAKLLHLLIIGPTGSGKSIAIKCLILSVIVNCPVDAARLLIFEFGSNSLTAFNDVLHMHHPIVKDVETGITVIESLVVEMNERYAFGEEECKNLPYLICVIDEFDDTIANITDKDDSARFTKALDSLIRRGRKAKIILVLASHDPTIKTTGINVNGIESRICFRVLKHQNSSAAGVPGADKLPGNGAMLFKAHGKIEPLQGSWLINEEIEQILSTTPTGYDNIDKLEIKLPEDTFSSIADGVAQSNTSVEKANKTLADIAFWALGRVNVSARQIQKQFRIHKKSGDIADKLHEMGIVEEKYSNQSRKVLPACYTDLLPDTAAFLERYGYTKEKIEALFNVKNNTLCSSETC